MFSGNDTLVWILVGAVIVSLGLSAVAVVLQIRRGRSKKQTPVSKAKANVQESQPVSPSQSWQPVDAKMMQGPWQPPANLAWREDNDYEERTQALFSGPSSSRQGPGGAAGQHQGGAWQIKIQETSPTGTRAYEITVNGEFPVGRSVDKGLQIANATVSGLQCLFIAGPDCVFIKNRSESNVTRLNGVKLDDTRPLKAGDTLGIGNVSLSLQGIYRYAAR